MKLRRIIALMLLLGANAQVFAQQEAGSLIACPDGKCAVEDQTTLEEKQREAEASGKNLFCVDIDKIGDKPFVAKIIWSEPVRTPRQRGGYTTTFIRKEESKSIEADGKHSIDVTLPNNHAFLTLEDKNGKEFYMTSLKPNVCKQIEVRFYKDAAETLLERISYYQSKYNTLPDAQNIRSWLERLMDFRLSPHLIWEKGEEIVSEGE